MADANNQKMLLVVNPVSGKKMAKQYMMRMINRFDQAGYNVTACCTQMDKNAFDIVKARGGEFDIIVCCGGDGTLKETVCGVLTLGKEGSMYGYHTKRCAQGIFPVKTVDTTAAGDTFTGYFVGEIINGKTPEEALKTAAMASAIAVGKKGASTSIPTLAEVRDSL